VKELAGAGAIYIRLTKCAYTTNSSSTSDDDDDLVPYLTSPSTMIPHEHASTSDETSGAVLFRGNVTSAVVPSRTPETSAVIPPGHPSYLL